MTNSRRKRETRALMAETGMNYTAAMRELARRRAVSDADKDQARNLVPAPDGTGEFAVLDALEPG